MGKWIHRLISIDEKLKVGVCDFCGTVDLRKQQAGKFGYACANKNRDWSNQFNKPYKKFRGGVCEKCGFVPENICQLDVHHIDENHQNNDPKNLQTLCANCHRLISLKNM